jgi:hypothetical protein
MERRTTNQPTHNGTHTFGPWNHATLHEVWRGWQHKQSHLLRQVNDANAAAITVLQKVKQRRVHGVITVRTERVMFCIVRPPQLPITQSKQTINPHSRRCSAEDSCTQAAFNTHTHTWRERFGLFARTDRRAEAKHQHPEFPCQLLSLVSDSTQCGPLVSTYVAL